ncbi:MAG: 50S ribosomal protein L32 [bacterium]
MAEPKQKIARSTSKTRRGRKKSKSQILIKCKHCNEKILPHRVCPECGYYKDKDVVSVK